MTQSANNRRIEIVDAAIRILNEDGVDGLNMRRLARELYLQPMSLYHHVPNKSALLTLVITELGNRIVWKTYDGSPRDRIVNQLVEIYTTLNAIPWVTEILRSGTSIGIPPLRLAEDFCVAAAELGIDNMRAYGLWRASWYLISSELQWHNSLRTEEAPWYSTLSAEVVGHYPAFSRLFDDIHVYASNFDLRIPLGDLVDGTIAATRASRVQRKPGGE